MTHRCKLTDGMSDEPRQSVPSAPVGSQAAPSHLLQLSAIPLMLFVFVFVFGESGRVNRLSGPSANPRDLGRILQCLVLAAL